jgi:hypothetical protein
LEIFSLEILLTSGSVKDGGSGVHLAPCIYFPSVTELAITCGNGDTSGAIATWGFYATTTSELHLHAV